MAELGTGALLHDMGKLDLPDRVRLAHDDFTSAEASLYRDHVTHGITQGRAWGWPPARCWWWRNTTSWPMAPASPRA
jgi:hypothetical protein